MISICSLTKLGKWGSSMRSISGEYYYLGYKITIGTGGDPLWVFKCTKCGHKKYSVFKKLQDPSHNCVTKEKQNEFGTSNQFSGAETDSDAEGDI